MSYDIRIVDKTTKDEQYHPSAKFERGGTVPAVVNSYTGQLEQVQSEEAHVNVTYNYAKYYYEATDDDARFVHYDEDNEPHYGIRGLYGKTPSESIPMLQDMVRRIKDKYTDQAGNWVTTKRTRTRVYDKNGNEIDEHPLVIALTRTDDIASYRDEEYEVYEGDTSNYWEETAQNAILPLMNMIAMASQFFEQDNLVWDGD